jgi:hypothetical protein
VNIVWKLSSVLGSGCLIVSSSAAIKPGLSYFAAMRYEKFLVKTLNY